MKLTREQIAKVIADGQAIMGMELGSTRIKAVLIGPDHAPIAQGEHEWENQLVDGIWTYSLETVHAGVQDAYASLKRNVSEKYGVELTRMAAMGVSAMMHGYLVFDEKDELLVPFRTWRNTITEEAAAKLTELFQYNIPQRWSIAHLYQAMLNGEPHVKKIRFQTTLAGYIHWLLTGEKVLGVGEASGMFPIDTKTGQFDAKMAADFNEIAALKGMPWTLQDIFPKVLYAGESGGVLTEAGARFLDPDGKLEAGIPVCPPEGDAGTGMAATNSVKVRTGNISAGTSIFAMVVLEKELEKVHRELDLVTTPDGKLVAMVHCNNCTSDLNAWVGIFRQFAESLGVSVDMNSLYGTLYRKALEGDPDCGGVLAYNYYSGEGVTAFDEGRPLLVRRPDAEFNLANFMRANLYSAAATLKVGLDILLKEEGVKVDSMLGHGGLFKTEGVAQKFMAAAVGAPVAVMETAGEGGPWGMALLAAYMVNGKGTALADYLETQVFAGARGSVMEPDMEDVLGFDAFIKNYVKGLAIERTAVENIPL
ncbi:MAG: FGGY-family carbohydrate kinase [Lachnospiraceae bacterium]|nr:FGGY-family carbohydrate kinase [Lachnospiraceae bacterium]